ncbi:MAG: helix-turn-helix domain-containing protein [Candidatus Woesearchaeota archaeon]|jgi:sugar-specific transcriptional regulator TrmB|nr:helix-turn-helix domain-containing protein [Candidatus Woesearchaeota archaeon]MDP7181387.1 helix-turn-helix domain-containing protein [Candidatus Woesearchaeota archaeon]MDP7197995.1 helix-turn-helix domain-containing protein [Candidatus Woesearchaeota archaeon]MDP7466829.1 helix-turn-helix domain-containing protein [Candidatus Woesearchaeota archaeon]MDP7648054.1 helix-turn-helix domain-containing protein [Candidatus Woesearchaeota archaeon]
MQTALLENIGFTKGEIKVYLALLELGNTTTGPLILKSHVARSKVYEILERLKEKGLVTDVTKENARYFEATSPARIEDYINQKSKALQQQKQGFQKILPELLAKQKMQESKQEVKAYVGMEGLHAAFYGLMENQKKNAEYLAISFYGDVDEPEKYIRFFEKYNKARKEKKIAARILVHHADPLLKEKERVSRGLYPVRVTSNAVPTGVAVLGDTVITLNLGEIPRAFAIVCKENADRYRNFFNGLWKKSKPAAF